MSETSSPTSAAPYGRKTQNEPKLKEIHILWITAGLGCDGDSVSITAATQPSIEDISSMPSRDCPKCTCTTPCWLIKTATNFSPRFIKPTKIGSGRLSW